MTSNKAYNKLLLQNTALSWLNFRKEFSQLRNSFQRFRRAKNFSWWAGPDLNRRPLARKANVLTKLDDRPLFLSLKQALFKKFESMSSWSFRSILLTLRELSNTLGVLQRLLALLKIGNCANVKMLWQNQKADQIVEIY